MREAWPATPTLPNQQHPGESAKYESPSKSVGRGEGQDRVGSGGVGHELAHVRCRVAPLVEGIASPRTTGLVLILHEPPTRQFQCASRLPGLGAPDHLDPE